MEDLLAQTIYDTKKYNKKYVEKLFDIICSYYNIGYINLHLRNEYGYLGYFNDNDNLININLELIIKKNNYTIQQMNKIGNNYYTGFLILDILLHELEHVRQHRDLMYKNDIEGIILYNKINIYDELINKINDSKSKMSFLINKYLIGKVKINKLYRYSPDERLANIKSHEKVRNIALILDDIHSYYIFEYKKLNELINGYVKFNKVLFNGPTNYFFNKLDVNIVELKELSKTLDSIDKMKYGLEINDDDLDLWIEYAKCNELLLKTLQKR